MSNIFLDCGANTGISVSMFRRRYPQADTFQIFSFEANPYCASRFNKPNVKLIEKAVWTRDGKLDFYIGHNPTSLASSVFKNKKTGNLRKVPISVECIDFHKWIENHIEDDDHVVLKLDIEGAEYDVLNHLIDKGSIKRVSKLFVDWHYQKVDIPQKVHKDLVDKLTGLRLTPYSWCAEADTFGDINLDQ